GDGGDYRARLAPHADQRRDSQWHLEWFGTDGELRYRDEWPGGDVQRGADGDSARDHAGLVRDEQPGAHGLRLQELHESRPRWQQPRLFDLREAPVIGRVLILAGALAACSRAPRLSGQGEEKGGTVATRTINQVLAAHSDSLMALPGVVGTAIGLCDGEKCIKVMVVD